MVLPRISSLAVSTFALAVWFGPSSRAQTPLPPDPRLDRTARISVEGIAVSDLLGAIGRASGMELLADKYAADDKVIAFGPPRTLRVWLADIAALFNDRWTADKGPDGILKYTLTRDLRARRYEDGLPRESAAPVLARLERQVHALAETPEELARRPEDDPIRRRLVDAESRVGTQLFSNLSPAQREQVVEIRRLRIPAELLSPESIAIVNKTIAANVATRPWFQHLAPGDQPQEYYTKEDGDRIALQGIRFNLVHGPRGSSILCVKTGRFSDLVVAEIESGLWWRLPAHGNPYTRASVPAASKLPETGMIQGAAKARAWQDRLHALSDASGIAVVADYYRSRPFIMDEEPRDPVAVPPVTGNVDALDRLCEGEGYLWWARTDALLFRKRDWYEQRRYEIPDRWLVAMTGRLSARGKEPTPQDVMSLRDLTIEQIHGLMRGHDIRGSASRWSNTDDPDYLIGLPEMLRLLQPRPAPDETAALIDPRRIRDGAKYADLKEQATLYYAALTPAQKELVTPFLLEQETIVPRGAPETFRVHMESAGTGGTDAGFLFVRASIEWGLGSTPQTPYTVYLPLTLPDDRRSRTKLELVGVP